MKTSFAKTFKNLSLGKFPKDEVFNKDTICEVKKEDETLIEKEEIFVINSFEDDYSSKNTSKLIARKELKEKYEVEIEKIEIYKNNFLTKIKEMTKIKDCPSPNKIDTPNSLYLVFS
ncbi:GTPase involved in cell partitioning and DNA repair [Clostridium punense]|uniref:GTPase involved in cell partitioning and DNA repair n=1 Tax=Clostridium punense TaxID=1054297 RepID=A0ABS4K960_9CLOT|nr:MULTISPECIES: hypothetical protein [Clostridium]MBP2024320.1 GTPase involved in cell partitioning and DNA repair [Clostridium punense]